jgi:hypothetical protein
VCSFFYWFFAVGVILAVIILLPLIVIFAICYLRKKVREKPTKASLSKLTLNNKIIPVETTTNIAGPAVKVEDDLGVYFLSSSFHVFTSHFLLSFLHVVDLE